MNLTTKVLLGILFSLRFVPAASMAGDNSAASNRIFAQSLVNQEYRDNPQLLLLGIHAVPPGAAAPQMVACNLDRIGKQDSPDDIAVAKEHKTIGLGTLKQGKFVVLLPLKDAQGEFTGAALGVAFAFHRGDDEAHFFVKAIAIAARMARQLPRKEALFESARTP